MLSRRPDPLFMLIVILTLMGPVLPTTIAADRGMLGGDAERTMTAEAHDLPVDWDTGTGRGVLWKATLGSETYGGPVVAGGKVFVGTNNDRPREDSIKGDRGVVMAFDAATGAFLWQAVHDKLAEGRSQDWPQQGVCSTPHVEGDRLYYVSNRGELIAADTEGFRDNENDGPFVDETRTGQHDVDIVWTLDMRAELGVVPRYMTASSPLVVGRLVFAATSNGPGKAGTVPAPGAPSFIAVDRASGKIVWTDHSPGDDLIDGQWASPSHATLAGRPQVLFPGGDGRLYSFAPDTGELLWRFDANLQTVPHGTEAFLASASIDADRVVIGVGRDPELGSGPGALYALRLRETRTGLSPEVEWQRGGKSFGRTLSTAAQSSGLIFATDLSGFVYCLDAATGERLWSHDTFAAVWASPLVADGKVYIGDEDGDVVVLRASRQKKLLGEINLGNSIYTAATAAGDTLYITTRSDLYALRRSSDGAKPEE